VWSPRFHEKEFVTALDAHIPSLAFKVSSLTCVFFRLNVEVEKKNQKKNLVKREKNPKEEDVSTIKSTYHQEDKGEETRGLGPSSMMSSLKNFKSKEPP
jgi:hypothetical protein